MVCVAAPIIHDFLDAVGVFLLRRRPPPWGWCGLSFFFFDPHGLPLFFADPLDITIFDAFYHPYECIFTDDVKRLHLKDRKDGRRVLQFFAVAIAKQAKIHDYGYKFNGERMERQNVMLPVDAHGEPDYAFMEAYIRERENELLARYSAFVKGRAIPHRGGGGKPSS